MKTRQTKATKKWKLYKNIWMSTEPVMNGIWARKEGGHVVRARVTDAATGKSKEIFKVLHEKTAAQALAYLDEERSRIRAGRVCVKHPATRFSEFAASLLETKIAKREIRSAKGRERWRYTLQHLIAGTDGEKAERFVTGFGDYFLDRLTAEHVEEWKAGIAELIAAGDYSPTTANGWLSIFRVILKAAKRKFNLPFLATADVKDFDTSEHATYTEEEPNALAPEEVPLFLMTMRDLYPQHYAMTYLGLITGLRPSTLRPLRRRGGEADVLWDKARILVRRSQTLGDEVMNTTKTKRRYPIDLPTEAMSTLKWHVDTQLGTPEMEESDLLFPSVTGKFRSPSILNKPFADVVATMGLGRSFTQRGLRRTFNDLTRAADVEAIVTRSISGHETERMQNHYSTVHANEQREAISRVIRLFGGVASGEHSGEHAPRSGEQNEKAD